MKHKAAIRSYLKEAKQILTPPVLLSIFLGTAIGSFGVYNIHQPTGVTEGGVIGLILLINHWTGLSPSILSPLLDIAAYAVAFRYLGRKFLTTSIVATISLAGFFRLWECFPPVLPNLSEYPLVAAIFGALFIGLGCGLVIRQGGSGSGDDALALTISKVTKCRISIAYLATDLSVLLLSLSYIPIQRIAFSLLTVTLSSFLIDFVQNVGRKKSKEDPSPNHLKQLP